MKFTSFYSNCPVCSGSRTALLTGCHYQRLSMAAVLFPRSGRGLHPDEVTIADMLKDNGYATACVGKWHLGHLPPCLPTMQGFDTYYGVPYSNDMWIDKANKLADDIVLRGDVTIEQIKEGKTKRNDVPLMRDDQIIEYPTDQALLTKRYTEQAIQFIKQNKDKPFFVYMPHTMCHYPLHASEAFKGKSGAKLFGDVIEELDWSVGQIMQTLRDLKIDDNTLVIFTTDNGPAPGSSGPLRAKKGSLYEGGVRVPCIMRWPGKIPAGKTCDEVAATTDMLPTIAAITGGKTPSDRKIDGKDIRPLMFGKPNAKSPHEQYVLLHQKGSVRSGQWKYYPWPEGGDRRRRNQNNPPPEPDASKPKVQLYDLSTDLSEKNNVAADHPDVVKRMHTAYEALKQDVQENKRPTAALERG